MTEENPDNTIPFLSDFDKSVPLHIAQESSSYSKKMLKKHVIWILLNYIRFLPMEEWVLGEKWRSLYYRENISKWNASSYWSENCTQ